MVAAGAEDVVKTLHSRIGDTGVVFAEQYVQRGTGDAVLAGLAALDDRRYSAGYLDAASSADYLDDDGHVLIVHGDLPLLTADLLVQLVDHHQQTGAEATVLASPAVGPFTNRPRLRRKPSGALDSIATHGVLLTDSLDEADAEVDNQLLAVTGCYMVRRGHLAAAIRRTTPQNPRGEFNLNDALVVLASAGHKVETLVVGDGTDPHSLDSLRSIGSYEDLAMAEAMMRQRITTSWMARGVRMVDPSRTYIDADVVLGTGVTLQPGTILRGFTVVGDHAEVGPDTHLTDCAIGQRAKVIRTTGRDAEVGPDAVVGPFAALEPGAQIAPNAITGPNFVGQYSD